MLNFEVLLSVLTMLASQCLLTCDGFLSNAPITVCQTLDPHHHNPGRIPSQPINTSPYRIHVSNTSYTPGAMMTVEINGTKGFKGFLIQARAVGDPKPVGTFEGSLPSDQTYMWCSGGEPQNTVAHRHDSQSVEPWDSVEFTWKAPETRMGNISFWAIVVNNFSIFWSGIQSVVVSGPPAANGTAPTLEPGFTISKQDCGSEKSCYSEPEDCTNSSNCDILVTYKTGGDNITFEMSGKHGYVAAGFNSKQEMNQTDAIICSTSSTSAVQVRHYFLDYHQPIRSDLRNSTDIVRHTAAYENGTLTCRFSRKISPSGPNMRDLTNNWFFLFAWSGVSGTGALRYHHEHASFSAERVNVTRPAVLQNGRKVSPAPGGKLEFSKSDCGKTKSCYSEPTDCSSSSNCDYLVTFKPCKDKDDVSFELSAKSDWVAIGFNVESKMDGTDALICSRLSNNDVAIRHYTLVNYNNPIPTNPVKTPNRSNCVRLQKYAFEKARNGLGKQEWSIKYFAQIFSLVVPIPAGVTVIAGDYEDGVIKCRFSRKKTASGIMRLDQKVFLIFARGSVTQGGLLNKHSEKSQSSNQVDVCELNAKLESKSSDVKLLRAHGALMIVAWIGFATMAILVARYMKPALGNLCGKKAWFQVHRALTISCVLFTITGFVLVFVHAEGWSDSGGAHSVLGVIITLLACVQPILALFRPDPDAEHRYIFNWTHRCVGITTFIFAIVNIILGLRLPHLDTKFAVYFVIAFCAGFGAVVALEIVLRCTRQKHRVLTDMTVGFMFVLVIFVTLILLLFVVREMP